MAVTNALLQHKLERAFAAWIIANRGSYFTGLPNAKILTAFDNGEPERPFLCVQALGATQHPQFEGQGRFAPQVVQMFLYFETRARDDMGLPAAATHRDTLAVWLCELDTLIAQQLASVGTDYSKIIAELNPPSSGTDSRTIQPLYIHAIYPIQDRGVMTETGWQDGIGLEVVAINGNPAAS